MISKIIKAGLMVFCLSFTQAYAANVVPTMIYIPQDNRPISYNQTVDAIATTGYQVITPEEKLLGNRENPKGEPEKLAQWLKHEAKNADYAILSSDALLYGSLVASRQEDHHVHEVLKRAKIFQELKEINPHLKVYVFGSIMRTPQSIQASGGTDAALYATYGTDIAKYTALLDKKDQGKLKSKDKKLIHHYEKIIPKKAIKAWLDLRAANLQASYKLIDYTKEGKIDYLALGADDNAPFSQTNMERRSLDHYAHKLGLTKLNYNSVAGIDELGYVLLTRGTNNIQGTIPFVKVEYAPGKGAATIPAYSNETIAKSITSHVEMTQGMIAKYVEPDVLLMVNTRYDGTTGAANNLDNRPVVTETLAQFIQRINQNLNRGYNVTVADIAFGNGADNGLMTGLYEKNLLNKLGGYAGWNTPTNSSGFALAMGMNANYMSKKDNAPNLATRYLDDWLYEANARQTVANELNSMPGDGGYMNLNTKLVPAEKRTTEVMDKLVAKYELGKSLNLPQLDKVQVTFPWNRMFEANFIFPGDK